MRPKEIILTGGGSEVTHVVPLNWRNNRSNFEVTIRLIQSAGASGDAHVEYTLSKIQEPDYDETTDTWTPVSGFTSPVTFVNNVADGNIEDPVYAIRIRLAAGFSGTVTAQIIQSGG